MNTILLPSQCWERNDRARYARSRRSVEVVRCIKCNAVYDVMPRDEVCPKCGGRAFRRSRIED